MSSCSSHFIEKFSTILNTDLRENVTSHYKLIEKNNIGTQKVSEMDINGSISNISFTLDKDIFCAHGDRVNTLIFLNSSTKNITKKNDLIVICPKDKDGALNLHVFIIELKSDKTSGAGNQILCGKIFVDYLINIYQLHFECTFKVNVNYYGIISSSKNPPMRQSTTSVNAVYHFNPIHKNGEAIQILNWNPKTKLPLNDIYRKVS